LALNKRPIYPYKLRDKLKNFPTSNGKFSDTKYYRDSKKIAINNGKETKVNSKKTVELHI
jgi:hypothetical protein